MRRNQLIMFFMAMGTLVFTNPVAAVDLALGVNGGTLGTGVGMTVGLTSRINTRFGVNSADISVDLDDNGGIDYNGSFEFDNRYVFLDLYLKKRGKLHLTAGLVQNDNSINASATVSNTNTLVGNVPAPVGTGITTSITFDDSASYVGIGWGNAVSPGIPFGFGIDVGVLMQGSPQVGISIIDPTNTIGAADIELERQDAQSEAEDFDMWPVVNLSFSFRF